MSEVPTRLEVEDLQQNLAAVQEVLARLRPAEDGAVIPEAAPLLAEIRGNLERLHPADIAVMLEALPLDERLIVWDSVKADRDGEILLEVSDAVRESLIASME